MFKTGDLCSVTPQDSSNCRGKLTQPRAHLLPISVGLSVVAIRLQCAVHGVRSMHAGSYGWLQRYALTRATLAGIA